MSKNKGWKWNQSVSNNLNFLERNFLEGVQKFHARKLKFQCNCLKAIDEKCVPLKRLVLDQVSVCYKKSLNVKWVSSRTERQAVLLNKKREIIIADDHLLLHALLILAELWALKYLFSRSTVEGRKTFCLFFFLLTFSSCRINSAPLVRGSMNIPKMLKWQKPNLVFADLPPKTDVTDDIIGNRERWCINI